MKQLASLSIIAFMLISGYSNNAIAQSKELPNYPDQNIPGEKAKIFAPGIVNCGLYTRDIVFSTDGNEIYFGMALADWSCVSIFCTRKENGTWTKPEVLPHLEQAGIMHLEPCISPDGKKLYFLSDRKDSLWGAGQGGEDIWVMDRTNNGWSKPYNLGTPINSKANEFYPSIAKNGNMYFTRSTTRNDSKIYVSKYVDGKYTEPELLPIEVNSGTAMFNAFIHPNEEYIIVPTAGRNDSYGGTDYYISFRNSDGTWQKAINMGKEVNTQGGQEFSASLSPDGKFMFFMSPQRPELMPDGKITFEKMLELNSKPGAANVSIYWISTEFIEKLKNTNK